MLQGLTDHAGKPVDRHCRQKWQLHLGDKVQFALQLLTIERNGGQEKTPGLPHGNAGGPNRSSTVAPRGRRQPGDLSYLPTYLPTA